MAPTPSHTIGFPRIGDKRQMKVALERYWKKQASYEELLSVASATEAAAWRAQAAAGISRIGLDGTLYDQLLDTTAWLGVIPARFQGLSGAARYFAMARGAEGGCTALDMSKLFDTNYHYLVPELEDNFIVNPDFSAILDKVKHGQECVGVAAAVPMIIGPLTFVSLARGPAAADIPSAVRKVLPAYVALLQKLRELQVPEVQLHEPAFCTSAGTSLGEIAAEAYRTLAGAYAAPGDASTASSSPELHLVTFYDDVGECYPWLVTLPVAAITLDFLGVPGSSSANRSLELLTQHGFPDNKRLGAGIVDGRSVWADEAGVGAALLAALRAAGVSDISITSSAPLQHLPYDVELETNLDSALRTRLGFAVQKLQDIATLASLSPTSSAAAAAADLGLKYAPKDATTAVDASLLCRPEGFESRRAKQLQFRPLPTTTIGSFPQTAEVRRLRLQYKQGRVSEAVYREELRGHIAYAIGVQEGLDIDVLVHGEAERTDMVEYFGQSLEGMLFTEHGWVQSYGSRYVRPPLVVADVRYRGPMTTHEFQIAQSLTVRPVKGMLTGPVTILNWSFPRKDISRAAQAQQLAHALRQEVAALEAVGCRIVQVDEPALREGLPLKRERWDSYLKWAVDAFKLCTAIAAPATQIVTHLCYSDFADILHAIDAMDADVLTIENSRSGDEMLRALAAARYGRDIGPGVYDVHSPVVPSVDFVADKIRMFLASGILNGRSDRIWVNPDCGLKTRGWEETIPSLRNMVAAAALVRAELAAGGAKAPAPAAAGGGGGAGGGGSGREVCACCI